jgi:diamine N-acetyltransferase
MSNRIVLRRATLDDADQLAALCQKTFRETFVEDFTIPYPAEDLDDYFRSAASTEAFAKKIADLRRAAWVIEDQDTKKLLAYALAGPCDDIPHPQVQSNIDGEISRLYVQRDQQGHGYGQQLMNLILRWLDEHYPQRPIWLSVWSKNLKAQKFDENYGFSIVGHYDYPVGQWKDHEFIMRRHYHRS